VAKSQKAVKLYLVSLGCAKNLVDSERILGLFGRMGATVTSDVGEADLAVVNTCAFIKEATAEALETVFQVRASLKPGARLLVLGCLPSRYGSSLPLGEADLLLPRDRYGELPAIISGLFPQEGGKAPLLGPFESWDRQLGTPPWRAFLKVSEGCDHACAYCVIPKIRGPLVIRDPGELASEASGLASKGVLELTLVAQDLTAYPGLVRLLARLGDIPGIRWIRLMYLYPERVTREMLKAFNGMERLVPYLDVPFQHASRRILRSMGRGSLDPRKSVDLIRAAWPGAAIRTTLMTGFPGEDEGDFKELLNFVEESRFEHAGFFKFSPEEGARAAGFPGQVPQFLKERRRRRLQSVQSKITEALNKRRIGQSITILVDGTVPGAVPLSYGRGTFQAPEVDGQVFFEGEQPIPGTLVKATIKKARGVDLVAVLDAGPGQRGMIKG
jgi:ribosomal protein S12 methylthiotransferase RimO